MLYVYVFITVYKPFHVHTTLFKHYSSSLRRYNYSFPVWFAWNTDIKEPSMEPRCLPVWGSLFFPLFHAKKGSPLDGCPQLA